MASYIYTFVYIQPIIFGDFSHAEFEVTSLKMKSKNNVRLGGFGCKGLGHYKENITLMRFL